MLMHDGYKDQANEKCITKRVRIHMPVPEEAIPLALQAFKAVQFRYVSLSKKACCYIA